MRAAVLVLALGAITYGQAAEAGNQTGQELLKRCDPVAQRAKNLTGEQETDAVYCLGYIRGISDGIQVARQLGLKSPVCVPGHVSGADLVDVVVKYLRANPGELHRHPAPLATAALGKAFPCR